MTLLHRFHQRIGNRRLSEQCARPGHGPTRHKSMARKLTLEALEPRQLLSLVSWDGGGGDLQWTNRLNWVGDQVPGTSDDATIGDLTGSQTISLGGTQAVRSVTCAEGLNITGSLTVTTGASTISGPFTASPGSSVTVQGVSTSLTATGTTVVDASSLIASAGGNLALPNVTSLQMPADSSYQLLQASGFGSVLDLHKITSITHRNSSQSEYEIKALAGGHVDLSGLVQVNDPAPNAAVGVSTLVTADGTGSLVDFSTLVSFQDISNVDYGYTGYSTLTAKNGGTIQMPLVTSLNATSITLDGTGTLPTDQLTAFTNGILTVSGAGHAFPKLTNANHTQVTVNGVATSFPALTNLSYANLTLNSGATASLPSVSNIDGASLSINGGVTLTLPSVSSMTMPADASYSLLQASGFGSVLDLHKITSITHRNSSQSEYEIKALAGGHVDLSGLVQVNDPAPNAAVGVSTLVTADGTGSLVDFSTLVSFQDISNVDYGYTGYSTLTAKNGGTIQMPLVTSLNATSITLDGTGTLPTDQLTAFTNGSLTVSGAGLTFPKLTNANHTQVTVSGVATSFPTLTNLSYANLTLNSGATASLPSVSNIDGASLSINGGVTLTLPSVSSMTMPADASYSLLQASGFGSVLDLHKITSITHRNSSQSEYEIKALAGGHVDLSGLVAVNDPAPNATVGVSTLVTADGTGSLVDFSTLVSFQDISNVDYGYTGYSTLTAKNGGTIQMPLVTSLNATSITLDGTGTLPTDQLTAFTNGSLTVSGAGLTFPKLTNANHTQVTVSGVATSFPTLTNLSYANLTLNSGATASLPSVSNIDGASLSINGGVTLTLPSVSSMTMPADASYSLLQASGFGSVLDLHKITSITHRNSSQSEYEIKALAGGHVDLSGLVAVNDPAPNATVGVSTLVTADGTGSLVDFSTLVSFQDISNVDYGYTGYSTLTAKNGGTIQMPLVTSLNATSITLDGTGTLPTDQLTAFTNGSLTVSGAGLTFPKLTNANHTQVTVSGVATSFPTLTNLSYANLTLNSGATASLPSVSNIDGASLSINGGVTLTLPSVSSMTMPADASYSLLQASGFGSVLDLHKITSITHRNSSQSEYEIKALAGGHVDLSGLVAVNDPAPNATVGVSTLVTADGTGSLVDFSTLVSFQDISNVDYGYTGYSTLTAKNGGTIALGSTTNVSNTNITIEPTSKLLVGTLDLGAGLILSGHGEVDGSLINRGTVTVDDASPGLIVRGDYTQTVSGTLNMNVDGAVAVGNYSVLQVTGAANLAGTLAIQRASGYTPDVESDYAVIAAGQVTGTFSTVTGGDVAGGTPIAPVYSQQVVVLSRGFDRTEIGGADYVNSAAGTRVFLDVTQVTGGPIEFRLYDPDGQLVTVTNATPTAPSMGDIGPFTLAEAGTYHVKFFARPGDSPTYTWQIAPAPLETFSLALNRAMTGTIAATGETHAWLFDAGAGAQVSLAVKTIIGTGQTLAFTLVAPDGRIVARNVGDADHLDTAGFATMTLVQKGTYRLVVEGQGDDTASYQFVLTGPDSPRIQASAAKGSTTGILDSAWFYFSQPMDTSTSNFNLATDILDFRGSAGTVTATGASWADSQTLVITFPAQPADQPLFMLLSPEILTAGGIPLDQNGNGVAGEIPGDEYTADLVSDVIGPRVFLTDPAARVSSSFDHLTFHFSESIDPRTVSINDITSFKNPSGASLLGQITNVLAGDDFLTVFFNAQTASGTYTMTLAPVIADVAGNLMDQNRDGKQGQTDDAYTASIALTSADLVAVSVANPVNATYGDTLHLSWTVRNDGTDPAQGVWWDYVYLSTDDKWDLNDTLIGKVFYDSSTRGAVAAKGGTYTGTLDTAMPGVLPGSYRLIVRTDLLQGLAEASYANNTAVSTGSASFDLPTLTGDQTLTASVNYRQALYYKVVVTPDQAGSALVFRFGTNNLNVANELYVRYGDLPSRQTYDIRSDQGLTANQWLAVYGAKAGTYYVLAAATPDQLTTGLLGTATVHLDILASGEFSVLDTTFGQGGTAGNRTIAIHGINFDRTMTVSLASGGTTAATATSYYRGDQTLLYATFDLTTVAPGTYDVVLQESTGSAVKVASGIEVVSVTTSPKLDISITAPPAFRRVFHAALGSLPRNDHVAQQRPQ